MEVKSRLTFIDNAKAIGIVLVIFAHLKGVPEFLTAFIYSFHMPLFFFLSGYLLSDYKLNLKIKDYIDIQIKSLVVPYFFFGFFSILLFLIESKVKHKSLHVTDNLLGLLYGVGQGLEFNVVLWFFTCLFSVMVVYYVIAKFFTKTTTLILSCIIGLLVAYESTYLPFRLPWNFELAFVALVFFAMGNYLASTHIMSVMTVNKKACWVMVCVSLLLCIYFSFQNGRVDMNGMVFNSVPLYFLSGVAGVSFIIFLSSLLPVNKIAVLLSKNTIVIFPMHLLLFSTFSAVGILVFHCENGFQNSIAFAIAYTVLVLVFSMPIAFLIRRYYPFLIGGVKVKGNDA